MTGMTRRTVMQGGVGALAVAALPARPLRAAGGAVPALFVFDARFPLSQTAAADHGAGGVALLDPRMSDLGVAWRTRVPQLLAQGGAIAGLTLWSDCLISQIYAREHGLAFSMAEVEQDRAGLPLYHWWAA